MIDHKDIHEAILAIYGGCGYVQKRGQMKHGEQYTYATDQDLIAMMRPLMVDHGVYMAIQDLALAHRETFQTSRGSTMNDSVIVITVRFMHAPSGTWIDVQSGGEGADIGDKSIPKAITGAYKYALLKTFCLGTGDDPDDTSSTGQERQPSTAPSFPEQARAAVAAQQAKAPARYVSDTWTSEHGIVYEPSECPYHPGRQPPFKEFQNRNDGSYFAKCTAKTEDGYCTFKPGYAARTKTPIEEEAAALGADLPFE